jgi:hypothetical protein
LPLELVKFDESAATAYGQIQTGLEREEKVIESMDMLIAAHAGTNGAAIDTCAESQHNPSHEQHQGVRSGFGPFAGRLDFRDPIRPSSDITR